MAKLTAEKFGKRVSEHELTILRDDGIYRHIVMSKPNTGIDSFEIVTWPGSLCYTGDMGTFVFSRIEDMLQFFRRDELTINESYWAEKLDAVDRNGGHTEYSEELFRNEIESRLKDAEQEFIDDDDHARFAELKELVEEEILSCGENEEAARGAIGRFDCDFDKNIFSDFWEVDLKDYTFRFLWCLFAIVWSIQKYDEHKNKVGHQ